jgi:hypothetical protein
MRRRSRRRLVTTLRTLEDGRVHRRVTEAVCPTLRVVPNPRVARHGPVESIGWVLPIDDTHYRIYVAGRVIEKGELGRYRSRMNGKPWAELTAEERRRFPGDYEAQTGQGPITFHSEEHLATSDKGVAFLRRFMEQQLKAVAEGGNPAGTVFSDLDACVKLDARQEIA